MTEPSRDEADQFIRRFKLLLWGAGLAAAGLLLAYPLYLDYRLASFEDALRYSEPSIYDDFPAPRSVEYSPLATACGQSVYVPAYSHVYHQDGRPHLLTITLSVRNTCDDTPIIVESADFFDTSGQMIRSFLERPIRLAPYATTEFLVHRNDTSGGSGASFLVQWYAEGPVTEPVIESVMIDTSGQQGISFARQGHVVEVLECPVDTPRDASDGEQ